MARTTWGRINELFEAARRLPADQREAWVRTATADERVRTEVLSLLHAHEGDPWFVDEPGSRRTPARITPPGAWPGAPKLAPTPAGPGGSLPASSSPPRRQRTAELKGGGQFGAYRLVREMARDAARLTFEAMATGTGAHPRVALHVLTADWSDPEFAALLHAHGRVLAQLDHPAIPRLIDGGVTDEGTAFVAFEYATGDPIDVWCGGRNLSVRDRVQYVAALCDAVAHAHTRFVAHGDLRPANVLVSADAALKLLDCGMAALLASAPAPAGALAPVHLYMSPEQARGGALTTASDVYGIGVLLYVLLTGYPPYEIEGQPPERARQMICGLEPDVPSTIVAGRDRKALAGTLDRIVLKALRKSPRERYPTAAALVGDLRAWAGGRPASVAPVTIWSRIFGAGAWPAGRLGALGLIVALAAGAGALGWQASLLRRERNEARANLVEAEHRRQLAEAQAARRPPVAELRLEIAAATSDLALAERRRGDLAKAEALWTQALADLRPVLDATPADILALSRAAEDQAFLGSVCRSLRRFDESLAHYREAMHLRARGADAPDAPSSAPVSLAVARTDVARLLLDLIEVRQPGSSDAGHLREAGMLLALAGPALRTAAPASPVPRDALADVDRQTARLRRLTNLRG